MNRVPVAIALGSNVGDRRAHLEWAITRIGEYLADLRASTFIETEPVGVDLPQANYLNAVLVGETALSPRELLQLLLTIEQERGRTRPSQNAPRTLDLDLILYGSDVIDEPGLTVPHRRFRERRFVLEPLAEVAPEMRDPVSGDSVSDLLSALRLKPST
jgi:2-amino-4-hydroxy-6-hydroxymethyldihydropteridine diphosphokinase